MGCNTARNNQLVNWTREHCCSHTACWGSPLYFMGRAVSLTTESYRGSLSVRYPPVGFLRTSKEAWRLRGYSPLLPNQRMRDKARDGSRKTCLLPSFFSSSPRCPPGDSRWSQEATWDWTKSRTMKIFNTDNTEHKKNSSMHLISPECHMISLSFVLNFSPTEAPTWTVKKDSLKNMIRWMASSPCSTEVDSSKNVVKLNCRK